MQNVHENRLKIYQQKHWIKNNKDEDRRKFDNKAMDLPIA